MKADRPITDMLSAPDNERDNTIAMVEHTRGLAETAIKNIEKGEHGQAVYQLKRIVALNPPAMSNGTNVEL